jgi:hypothetical protein
MARDLTEIHRNDPIKKRNLLSQYMPFLEGWVRKILTVPEEADLKLLYMQVCSCQLTVQKE